MARSISEAQEAPTAVAQEIAETGWAYLDGEFMTLSDAKVSIATHALQYGTAVFEGIRAYWNAEHEELYAFRLREHFERMHRSCRIVRIGLPATPEELSELSIELLRRCAFRTDTYVRPLAFKAARTVKVTLGGLRDGFGMYAFPIGAYLPIGGLSARTTSWRRTSDDAIPARGKLSGSYINTALAVDEAHEHEADEAIFLTRDGHVSEGGGSNLFMIRDGVLVTPPVTDDILEGLTRDSVMNLAREDVGLETVERQIDRTELFIADEVFFCGTGAQVAPCVRVDGRQVGDGAIGPLTARIAASYFAVARGDDERHPEWRTPVYTGR
ncbi:MAG: branched-chain amino acid transaminase [Chloroflexota bacterium]|nr:branched-chain amino acid transaminase [Chloroflexota bacterium]